MVMMMVMAAMIVTVVMVMVMTVVVVVMTVVVVVMIVVVGTHDYVAILDPRPNMWPTAMRPSSVPAYEGGASLSRNRRPIQRPHAATPERALNRFRRVTAPDRLG
jgi:hypothetical protein